LPDAFPELVFYNTSALAVVVVIVWWRLERIERRIDDLLREMRGVSERVARLEGWRNGVMRDNGRRG